MSERTETLSFTIPSIAFSSAEMLRWQAPSKTSFSNADIFDIVPFQVGTSTWLQHFLSLADLPEEEEEIVQHRLHAEVHLNLSIQSSIFS